MPEIDPPTTGPAAADEPALQVGVRLAPAGDVPDWLREAEAYETAGAQALWIGDPGPGLDAGALVAALAAVTYRTTLVLDTAVLDTTAIDTAVLDTGGIDTAERSVGTVLATIQAVAHDRVLHLDRQAIAAALGGDAAAGLADSQTDSRMVVLPDGRRWAGVPAPQGRAEWRESLRRAAEAGAAGVVVPASPRLLDILRNPADPEGRQDLHLSFG